MVVAMTLRTDAELDEALTALAQAQGISRQEVVRRAVLEQYAASTHHAKVADASQRMLDKWGDVLDRLGTV
jgi:predicted transcriptional regulator